jgi:hypothetical protein
MVFDVTAQTKDGVLRFFGGQQRGGNRRGKSSGVLHSADTGTGEVGPFCDYVLPEVS